MIDDKHNIIYREAAVAMFLNKIGMSVEEIDYTGCSKLTLL